MKGVTPFSGDELRDFRTYVQFLDGAFHHYRTKSYTRLIFSTDEASGKNGSSEILKDKISSKADKLSDLILETEESCL